MARSAHLFAILTVFSVFAVFAVWNPSVAQDHEIKDLSTDPADIESPSDMKFPLPLPAASAGIGPQIRVELSTGQTFEGALLEPTELRMDVLGAKVTWGVDEMVRVEMGRPVGRAEAFLKNGMRISGTLDTPYVTMRKGYGKLNFARSRIRRLEVVGAVFPAQQPAQAQRLAKPPVQELPSPRSDNSVADRKPTLPTQPAVSPSVVEVLPVTPTVIGSASDVVVLHFQPDSFRSHPGIPTWHAQPVVVPRHSSYPRNFYRQPTP